MHGPVFQRLRDVLNREDAALQLRADPMSLAPERVLVFEVNGPVQDFARAVTKIKGLEFAGEEELEPSDPDEHAELYLLVPQLEALNQILSLWERWAKTGELPQGYAPWRNLFFLLRSVRPWGPQDRVSPANRDYLEKSVEDAPDDELIRIEVELVFRKSGDRAEASEKETRERIQQANGRVINRSRRPEFGYHALLVDLPAAEIRRIAKLSPTSLAGVDPVVSIVPQSLGTVEGAGDRIAADEHRPAPQNPVPIAGILDAVPVQAHPLLRDYLISEDPQDLEARAVGERVHGTAMASLVIHGDLNDLPTPISRRVYFQPVMYASASGDERFQEDKLIIDVIVAAVMHMRENGGEEVIVVNLSLGDRTRPFSGRISTWARALDYLAFSYHILFLVSAGNADDKIILHDSADEAAFLQLEAAERGRAIFRGLDAAKAARRILAPADTVNGLTVGAWHRDAAEEFPGNSPFSPYQDEKMPALPSRLGSGLHRATKPELLMAGGRQPVVIEPASAPATLIPHRNPSRYWGLRVAAPPKDGSSNEQHFTMGTSAATALATHTAHRIFDALEGAYPALVKPMALSERAVLVKALLVHAASWQGSENFIRPIIDPDEEQHHEHWRSEVSRHLGYGFVEPDDSVACSDDRATLWATGELEPDGAALFSIPIPAAFGTDAGPREVRATLAWFTPILPGHLAYRSVRLKLISLSEEALEVAGIGSTTAQPSHTQVERGTVVHRRWRGEDIGASGDTAFVTLKVQREPDTGTPIDEAIPFGLAVTVMMPGAVKVYDQVLETVAIKPRIPIQLQG